MQAGKLRHAVTLKSAPSGTSGQDEFGAPGTSYTTYATTWASIVPLEGEELMLAQQVNPELQHKVTIRYHSSVTNTDRIAFGSRDLEIVSIINPEERNERLELLCLEA